MVRRGITRYRHESIWIRDHTTNAPGFGIFYDNFTRTETIIITTITVTTVAMLLLLIISLSLSSSSIQQQYLTFYSVTQSLPDIGIPNHYN